MSRGRTRELAAGADDGHADRSVSEPPIGLDAPLGAVWARAEAAVSNRPRLRSVLGSMRPVSAGSGVLAVRVDPAKRAIAERTAAELAQTLAPALGHPLRIDVLGDEAGDPAASALDIGDAGAAGIEGITQDVRPDGAGTSDSGDPSQHPLVQNVVEVFGAKIVDITRKPPPG